MFFAAQHLFYGDVHVFNLCLETHHAQRNFVHQERRQVCCQIHRDIILCKSILSITMKLIVEVISGIWDSLPPDRLTRILKHCYNTKSIFDEIHILVYNS